MSTSKRRAVLIDFNPYEARYPGRTIVSREMILLAKRLRSEGFDITIRSHYSVGDVGYIVRKGFSDLLRDPVILRVFGVTSSVAIGLVTSWLYDLLKRLGGDQKIPDDLEVVIEIPEGGRSIRYDHRGRAISDERFDQLITALKQRQEAYASTLRLVAPDPRRPYPIYLEHTNKVIGWADLKHIEGQGLIVDPAVITDPETRDRIDQGELGGFSIAGIVGDSICQTCNSDYRMCNHGADAEDRSLNEIREIDLCEISIVRKPVNYACDFRENLKNRNAPES